MMDRALKERIIGAIVLVLFVVLVVPVFLDGPTKSGEIISENVPLPGQSGQTNQTIVLDRDRTEPVPAATINNSPAVADAAPEPEPQVQAVVVEKEEAPVEKQQPAERAQVEDIPPSVKSSVQKAPAASTTGMWAVQLGSFGNPDNAEKLAADLRKQGFAAFLSQLATGSNQLHRVRIGPQKDREGAEAMAVRLKAAGHEGQVVPHP
jgi:DedD protein